MRKRIHSSPPETPQAREASPPPAISNVELLYRPDASRAHAPVGDVKPLPDQHRRAVERAEDLIANRPPRHPPTRVQVEEAEAWLKAAVGRSDHGRIALEVFRAGAQAIEGRRRPRSENVE
jgi:hypothetical protein